MKAIVKLLVLLVVLVALAVGGALFYLDSIAKTAIEKGATYALGVPTSVDSVRIRLAGGSFGVSGLGVANPPGFDQPNFLLLGGARLELPPRRLLEDTVRVALLELENIDVDLEKGSKGSNYGAILDNLEKLESSSGQEAAADESADQGGGKQFIIERLAIRNVKARVAVGLLGSAKPAITVSIPEINLHDVGAEEGGVDMGELASIVTKAVLSAVTKAGAVPLDIAKDLAGNLQGLAGVAIDLPPGLGDAGRKLLGGTKDAAGGALGSGGKQVENALKGLGGLLGGKK